MRAPAGTFSVTHGHASQNGSIGINDYIIFQNRVSGNTFDGIAIVVQREAFGSQRDTLIEFYVIANDTGCTNHHACSVVYCEMMSYFCSRVDIYSGFRVCHFCNVSGNQRYTQYQQFMGYSVVTDGTDGRIAADYFTKTGSGRVSVIGCFYIGSQNAAHFGQLTYKTSGKQCCCFTARFIVVRVFVVIIFLPETQTGLYLVRQQVE